MPLDDRHKLQRSKNIALALILLAFIALFYFLAIIKVGATA
jgi:hypothetical protein